MILIGSGGAEASPERDHHIRLDTTTMRHYLRQIFNDLLHMIAPALCPGCDTLLQSSEQHYCGACRASLAPAPFPRDMYNEFIAHFSRDELALSAVASLYSFERDTPVEQLIYALKYRGCYRLGIEMGAELARCITIFPEFSEIDLVIPVPLHRARRRQRGYNQAEAIARGLCSVLTGCRIETSLLRNRHTHSQTTMNAAERRRNMQGVFRAGAKRVQGRTILLCDDVCTTGATLNSCASALLDAVAERVIAATVAKDNIRNDAVVKNLLVETMWG